ncbi:Sugar transferase involved in LPS biosynthesis (colanic, teichoic acid) [Pustulibacterium marinum]|uniref:Sugar transferase involved in LPS biosynthesis (Colanic, teichoic acid) n=1 Tax=Pustulibacterium marinum TaxID=1224947 RepID=A0A1I7HMD1_9FLAO|nr:sugar transferase [Pustulibacterium marinum]SFU61832.1 Sugar transferase involved in LPS biosynthesis (colanic, teichoic acid) [Pustulibacterium marinum]
MTVKRIFDIVLSIVLVIFFLVPLLVISLMVFLTQKEKVFFFQSRVGQYEKIFTIVKFCTLNDNNEVTLLGKFLRSSKFDELPQLFNVLNGDMSIVGPRPDVPNWIFSHLSKSERKKIFSVKPGMTSPASIKYVNEEKLLESISDPDIYYQDIIWPEKVKMNIDYAMNVSLKTDLHILLKTFKLIFN